MIYEITAKNTAGTLKTLKAGKKGIECHFKAKRGPREEHLDKKTFFKFYVNEKGEQVLEIFGSEPVIIKVENFKILNSS